jgi:hypothetical protein
MWKCHNGGYTIWAYKIIRTEYYYKKHIEIIHMDKQVDYTALGHRSASTAKVTIHLLRAPVLYGLEKGKYRH